MYCWRVNTKRVMKATAEVYQTCIRTVKSIWYSHKTPANVSSYFFFSVLSLLNNCIASYVHWCLLLKMLGFKDLMGFFCYWQKGTPLYFPFKILSLNILTIMLSKTFPLRHKTFLKSSVNRDHCNLQQLKTKKEGGRVGSTHPCQRAGPREPSMVSPRHVVSARELNWLDNRRFRLDQ